MYVLSVLNLSHALDRAMKSATETESDLLFLCSGEFGEVSYDDAFVAGLGIKYLKEKYAGFELGDKAELAYNAASNEKGVYDAFKKSRSGKYALSLRLNEDILFCSQMNRYAVTGKLDNSPGLEQLDPLLVVAPC